MLGEAFKYVGPNLHSTKVRLKLYLQITKTTLERYLHSTKVRLKQTTLQHA